jgi:hypothetical protein
MRRMRCDTIAALMVAALLAAVLAVGTPGAAAESKPPEELVQLERTVALRVAHARDEGPVEVDKRKLFLQAQQDDQNAEAAIQAGDYAKARSLFRSAGDLLDQLGL